MANVEVLGGLTKFFEGFLFIVCCRTYFERVWVERVIALEDFLVNGLTS